MKVYTNKDIRELRPCYDPVRHYSDEAEYTLLDILDNKGIPAGDKIWVVTKFLPGKDARLFAVWCAREALKLIDNPDPRSLAAVDTAEKYVYGKATIEELDAAYAAANDAAYTAAVYATYAAVYAVYAAADAADVAAVAAVADVAAEAAAKAAAKAAADVAAYVKAAREKQLEKLKEIILGEHNDKTFY